MRLIWLSWKDRMHPLAGGAELVTDQLCSRLAGEGHEVVLLTAGYPGATDKEYYQGYTIVRVGGRWTVYWRAFQYYRQNLRGWADIVVEEINTIPFFSQWYVKERKVLFMHQLCRQIWFYQMAFPLSVAGFLMEPLYLFLLRKNQVVTVSNSTKNDLQKYGYKGGRIAIISEGIELKPIEELNLSKKFDDPTVLSLGAIRPMKRTLDQIRAFEIARSTIPGLKMKVAGGGSGPYFDKVMRMIRTSIYCDDIEYFGKVDDKTKTALMQKCHLILVTSVKEGWGLIVTEANSQGTPAIVYDVDGLRDSVRSGNTGMVTSRNTPESMGSSIVTLLDSKKEEYENVARNALRFSKALTFQKSLEDLKKALGI